MNAGPRASLAAFVALASTAALVAGALASTTSTTTLASTGPSGGNGAVGAFFSALTPDGSRMLFATDERLVSEDIDSARDLYERANGVTTLVSTGPNGGNSDSYGVEEGLISADGTRVFFETAEKLVTADDTDTRSDIYERSGGVTTLISTGPAGGNGDFDVDLSGMSDDGTRVFLRTEESLILADTDTQADVYERSGATTTQVSTGPVGDDGNFQANFSANSADGTRVFFDTQEPLVADDIDTQSDTYERSGGTTTLVTTAPASGNGAFGAFVQGISQDGTHAFFQTHEPLLASDMDTSDDVYERTGGTTTLVSTGGNGNFDATFQDTSADGTRVLFTTSERLVADDTDSAEDVYERSGGVTSLVSAAGNGAFSAVYEDASADATHVFFRSAEPLVAADTDAEFDLYQRWRGATTLVSTGPAGGNGAVQPAFQAVSLDGKRVFFTTQESLVGGDTDPERDVYERSGGETTLVSRGALGGNGAFDAQFEGTSASGTLMFFSSQEQLVAEDTDAQADVYQANLSVPTDPPEVIPDDPKPPIVVADTTAPQTTITKRPRNRTRKRSAKFRFASTEAGSTFECKLDRKRYVPCRCPRKFKVKRGRHSFRVRAIDAAGNRDATPAIDRWKVLRK